MNCSVDRIGPEVTTTARQLGGDSVQKVLGLLAMSILWWACASGDAEAEQRFTILPGEIVLDGRYASQTVLLQQISATGTPGRQVPVTEVVWSVEDERVARWEEGRVLPVGDGTTRLTARYGKVVASAPVVVRNMTRPAKWLFRNHVQSVFSKAGCNSGPCHGALAGKGGFKLSLRGYDTDRDYWTITREARGRRIELLSPARSLLLTKPTGAVSHKGGVRFDPDSLEYRVVLEWLQAGADPPGGHDPVIERLEVLPSRSVHAVDEDQQLIVLAHFSDGHTEDVTRWAKFTSTNTAVADVDDAGRVRVAGHGESAILVWYLSKIVMARVVVPYPFEPVSLEEATSDARNFIDRHVGEKLAALNLKPSPLADDATFLRRVYLDTIGVLPTPREAREFLRDTRPDRRDRLIDALLARPEFVDYWTYKWSDLFLVNSQWLRPKAVEAYYRWLREQVAAERPWDDVARDILTATGSSFENGATNFYAIHSDPLEMAENVSIAFLGLNINCARCHNHPLEKWTNDQYYAFANLFARVRAKGWGGDPRNGDGLLTLVVRERGDILQPGRRIPQRPAPLDGPPLDPDSPDDRRAALAEWLTAPDNPYFARAIANRIWANFFGVGIVDPPDDMRESNPAGNERLLQALADYLVEHDYDLKSLMRVILQSATYQRSSTARKENEVERRYFSRYYPRRLMAEVLLDGISQVTRVPTRFAEVRLRDGSRAKTDWYPLGTRAIQLKDSAVDSPFLTTFGRNDRAIACECQRSSEPSLVQVLHLNNGATINEKLRDDASIVSRWLREGTADQAIIEEIFLAALARLPTDREQAALLPMVRAGAAGRRREVLEDLVWSVLTSREFLFQH